MKKILFSILMVMSVGICLAGDVIKLTFNNTTGTVATANMDLVGVGGSYLDSIHFNVTGTTTGTVTIISSNETVMSAFSVTADTVIRPRMPVTINGVQTNNSFTKLFLLENALKFTYSEAAPVTNSVVVKVYLTNDN